jgi:SAM-dependent methyltransferase
VTTEQKLQQCFRDADYWEQRFDSGDTPWELCAPSKVLFEALAAAYTGERPLEGVRVLLPGCGTGSDALELAKHGANILAVDWSTYACNKLQDRLASLQPDGEMGNVAVLRGDFFKVSPESVDLVCEHTFFCALNPAARPDYVSTVAAWLKPGGYLIGNFFVLSDKEANALPELSLTKEGSGPPFATTVNEMHSLFSSHFTIVSLRPGSTGESNRRPGMEWVGIFRRT